MIDINGSYVTLYELNSFKCEMKKNHLEIDSSICWFLCYDGFKNHLESLVAYHWGEKSKLVDHEGMSK